MKAITLQKNGGIENLTLTELATPKPNKNEVLIQIKAISINPVDAFVRQHKFALTAFMKPEEGQDTFILGWDVSGTIVEIGEGVTKFSIGDEVFGMVNFSGQGKTYAEYVAAPVEHLALKPKNISHQSAAAACLAALTALQSLRTYAKLQPGEKVLIHAAAGGVGHYAIQLAKYCGAYVIGTASAANREFVFAMGANEFIDYKNQRFEEVVNDVDVVIESLYGDHILRSLDAVKRGGRIISLLNPLTEERVLDKVKAKEVLAHKLAVSSNGDDMQFLAQLLGEGIIHSHIFKTYTFNDLPLAHVQIETGKTKGKQVVVL